MAERTNSRLRVLISAVAAAMCLSALPLRAQPGQLEVDPCKVAGFTEAEQQQIRTFVEQRLTLLDKDAADREPARRELLEPLARSCVSVAFRQLYRGAMLGDLQRLAASAEEEVAITALIILGELADEPARQELQKYTADERIAVRFAAIAGMKRTFRAINNAAPALDANRVGEMVRHLGDRLSTEEDPATIDLTVRTLIAAAGVSRDGYGEVAAEAMTSAAHGIGDRLRAASVEARPSVLLSTLRVGEALGGQLAAAGSAPQPVARAGAAFAGEVLAHLAFLGNSGKLPQSRQLETDLTNISERILVFAHQRLGKPLTPPNLVSLIQAGSDVEFFSRVQILVLSLEGDPCNLSAEAMERIRAALAGK